MILGKHVMVDRLHVLWKRTRQQIINVISEGT